MGCRRRGSLEEISSVDIWQQNPADAYLKNNSQMIRSFGSFDLQLQKRAEISHPNNDHFNPDFAVENLLRLPTTSQLSI